MAVDLRLQEFITDPYPLLAALREAGPIHEAFPGMRLVVTHEQVNRINRDPRLGRDPHVWSMWEERRPYLAGSELEWAAERFMLNMDPPAHTRLRRLVSQAFTPRTVAALAGPITAIADELLSTMDETGEQDLMSGFARPLPVRVILELIGLPATDLADLERWSRGATMTVEPTLRRDQAAAANTAVTELIGYLNDVVAWRRAHPEADRDDLLGALLRADTTDQMSPDETIGMLIGMFIAGHETTANLIGNGVLALSAYPDQWALLRADPAAVAPGAVEETLRYDSPVQNNPRFALDDVDIAGTAVPAGTLLWGMTGAANRDPAVFADPDRLDLTRDPNPHLSFGGGAHFCVGAGLSRLEGRIAFQRLAARFPRLVVDHSGVRRRPLLNLRGLDRLPLLTPARVT